MHTLYHFSSHFSFFFYASATPELYTLSLHDALPISWFCSSDAPAPTPPAGGGGGTTGASALQIRLFTSNARSEEHTSELQSRGHLVCRLLLEKKKRKKQPNYTCVKLSIVRTCT